jgi:hypothetical protein
MLWGLSATLSGMERLAGLIDTISDQPGLSARLPELLDVLLSAQAAEAMDGAVTAERLV